MAGMTKIGLNSLWVMSNVKDFALQDGQLAGWINVTLYIDPYDTHMDQ